MSGPMSDLAPVYLDDSRVKLQGDPKPNVASIVKAGGKRGVRVVRLDSPTDEGGVDVGLDQVIDRASESGPVYLRVVEGGEAKAGLREDESSGVGAQPQQQFGAARTGIAGQGATGEKEGSGSDALALDKQAKSDFTGPRRDPDQRNGASNQTYGAGDLAPGGRTGLTEEADRAEGGHLDGTQEFQSGGRQGEGGAPGYRDPGPVGDPAQGAQGGLRDSSTDHGGRQQGQSRGVSTKTWSGDPADARTKGYDDGHSSVLPRGQRPSRSREGDGSASADAD